MSIVTKNGKKIIVAPVSVQDVRSVLGVKSTDVGTLCESERINPWARYKPVPLGNNHGAADTPSAINDETRADYGYGIAVVKNSTDVYKPKVVILYNTITADSGFMRAAFLGYANSGQWSTSYISPALFWHDTNDATFKLFHRLTDFVRTVDGEYAGDATNPRGYEHGAEMNVPKIKIWGDSERQSTLLGNYTLGETVPKKWHGTTIEITNGKLPDDTPDISDDKDAVFGIPVREDQAAIAAYNAFVEYGDKKRATYDWVEGSDHYTRYLELTSDDDPNALGIFDVTGSKTGTLPQDIKRRIVLLARPLDAADEDPWNILNEDGDWLTLDFTREDRVGMVNGMFTGKNWATIEGQFWVLEYYHRYSNTGGSFEVSIPGFMYRFNVQRMSTGDIDIHIDGVVRYILEAINHNSNVTFDAAIRAKDYTGTADTVAKFKTMLAEHYEELYMYLMDQDDNTKRSDSVNLLTTEVEDWAYMGGNIVSYGRMFTFTTEPANVVVMLKGRKKGKSYDSYSIISEKTFPNV